MASDENMIFQGNGVANPSGLNQQPGSPISNQTQQPLVAPVELEGAPPPVYNKPSLPPSSGSGFSPKTLIKGIVGIIVVFIIIFILIKVISSRSGDGEIKLVYWGLWEDKKVMQPIISDFEKDNPKIKIEYTNMDIKDYMDRLTARAKDGNGPDIFRFHNTWLPEIKNLIAPLPSSVISADDFKKNYYPVTQKDLVSQGAIYGIPLSFDCLALFINEDILGAAGSNPPVNWQEFQDTASQLTVKEGTKIKTSGASMGTYDNIDHASDILSLLFVQNNADLNSATKTSKSFSDALNFYTGFAITRDNIWDATLDNSVLAFSKGNVAMIFGFSWDILTIKDLAPKVNNPNLKFKVVPVPHLPGGKDTTIASYWVEGVSINSKHQAEAMKFMKYLAKKETQQKLYSEESKTRLFGELYSRVDLADSLKDSPLVYPFLKQAPNATSMYFASNTFDTGLNKHLNEYLQKAVNSIGDSNTPESATKKLLEGVSQVLSQYGQGEDTNQ